MPARSTLLLHPRLFVAVALAACRGEAGTAPDPSPAESVPAAIVVVAGDAQTGPAGATLDQRQSVRVTDSSGTGVGGVAVHWLVTSGEGAICSPTPLDCQGSALLVNTTADGYAGVWVRPRSLGPITLTAEVLGTHLRVPFYAQSEGLLIRLSQDCGTEHGTGRFLDPAGGSDTRVPLGTRVIWQLDSPDLCIGRIGAISWPSDGAPFESPLLLHGDRYIFTPRVAGTWQYTDRESGAVGQLHAGPLPAGGFPPLSGPSRRFSFDRLLNGPRQEFTVESEILLYDNGAFALRYRSIGVEYRGGYEESAGVIEFAWEGWSVAGPWGATGLMRGETLEVRFNKVMQLSDFEDAVYVRVTP